jgi:cytochrome c oxidase assembly protein subunit 15
MAGVLLLVVLAAQVGLGIANVAARLPLVLAVAHNAGAAVLLATVVMINFMTFQGPSAGNGKP